MRVVAIALVLGHAIVASGASDPWERIRAGVIDPINTALHRHWPKAIKARDVDAVLLHYATDHGDGVAWEPSTPVHPDGVERVTHWMTPGPAESIRDRWTRFFARLSTIERAEVRIDRVAWRDATPDGIPVTVRILARGACAEGGRCQLEQHATLRIRRDGEHWRIAHETITHREEVARERPQFEDVTTRAGLLDAHDHQGSPEFQLFGKPGESPIGASGGSAVADIDGDGWEDIVLAGSPTVSLFRNRGNGTFENATATSGLPHPFPAVATGVLVADVDNDGWRDLVVSAIAGGSRLFRNVGGRFIDVTARSGFPADRWTSMATAADYDRDGFVDLYFVAMGDHERTVPEPNFDARNGVRSTLLRNRGDGTFEDVTRRAGVGYRGWGLAGAWGDYDDDGYPDLYVTNEFGGNVLYRNGGDGTFADVTSVTRTGDGGAGMGVAWGDTDGDGDLDLFVSNMHANSGWALFHPEFPLPVPWWARALTWLGPRFAREVTKRSEAFVDALSRGSTLFRNDGHGHFTDVSDTAGVRDAQWGWAAAFLDYDDDGHLDLYGVNGFVSGPIPDDL